jgi:hypothetical protein
MLQTLWKLRREIPDAVIGAKGFDGREWNRNPIRRKSQAGWGTGHEGSHGAMNGDDNQNSWWWSLAGELLAELLSALLSALLEIF